MAAEMTSAVPLMGGKSVHCINELQMEKALRLAEEDRDSAPKIQAFLEVIRTELNRNESAALAFVLIKHLKESSRS